MENDSFDEDDLRDTIGPLTEGFRVIIEKRKSITLLRNKWELEGREGHESYFLEEKIYERTVGEGRLLKGRSAEYSKQEMEAIVMLFLRHCGMGIFSTRDVSLEVGKFSDEKEVLEWSEVGTRR